MNTKIQKEFLDDELPHILSGAGAPGSTPAKVGNIYIDTINGNSYIAVGTASSADWKLNGGGGGGAFSGCRAYKSTTQSIGSSPTVVTFDLENYDTDTYHDNSTNNSRLTVPSTGYYRITASAPTATNTAFRASLRVDGTTTIQATGGGNAGASADNGPLITTDYYLTAGQYVEFLVAYLSSTSNALSGVGGTTFSIQKIG